MNVDVRTCSSTTTIADLQEDEDGVYFSSYGHYGIHEEMLKVGQSTCTSNLPKGEPYRTGFFLIV